MHVAELVRIAAASMTVIWTAWATLTIAAAQPASTLDFVSSEAVIANRQADAIDLTDVIERRRTDSPRVLVTCAPTADGIVRRMEVRARGEGTHWAVFALANPGDEQLERLIVIPRADGAERVAALTPSSGDRPERETSESADIFRITLDPDAVTTYVAELRTGEPLSILLWEPGAYQKRR